MNIDWDSLYLAYDWAKEWQVLLAGLLVLLAALIIAWATIRAAKMGSAPRPESKARSDLRREPTPASSPPPSAPSVSTATSGELISSLEQLRSLIRSALSSLPATDDKENNPANFLCQRILHLRLDQLPPPAHAGKAAQEGLSTLQKQLSTLRTQLKKDASPAELSEILVQINSSARSLVAALGTASEKRRQAGQDTR